MLEMLFDTPWWLPTLIIAIGLFVLYTGNQRQEKPVLRAGLAILLAGLLVILISTLVMTDRETVVQKTQQLVAAAGKQDWQTFQSLLDSQTSVYGLRGPETITEACHSTADRIQLSSARITGTRISETPTMINVTIRVLSEQMGRPFPTDWQLQYQKIEKKWILYTVRALGNEQVNEDAIKAAINRRL